jgi:transketolase
MFASHFQLSNLVVIIDENGHQAMGRTREVLDMGSFAGKLRAFGFETREVDGHDEAALDRVFAELTAWPGNAPRAVVAHTVKGQGVSFMADDNRWHYTRLSAETYRAALAELN